MVNWKTLGRIVTQVVGIVAIAVLGACNTMEGVGEDVEAAGEGLQDAAE